MSQMQGPRGLDRTMDISSDEPTLPAALSDPRRTAPAQPEANYSPGKASVGRASAGGNEPTLTFEQEQATYGGPGIATRTSLKQPSVPLRQRVRMLRRGGRWSAIGAGVLVGCWGLFALSSLGGDLAPATLALLVILIVGAFVFGVSRLVGLVILERSMGRVRRSAWASHAVAGLFWIAAGVTYLTRIGWVVDAFNFISGV